MSKKPFSPSYLHKNNTIIFSVDEYNNDRIEQFDGQIQWLDEKGAHVIYLSGHHSRNDHIPWKDIIAKLDKREPYISLENASFRGHFIEFEHEDEEGKAS